MTQVREPIHRRSVGRWERYARFLDPPMLTIVNPALDDSRLTGTEEARQ